MEEQSTLYLNGNIFTMDRDVPRAQALLVRGDRIAALGPRELLVDQADAYTRRVDLDGRSVIPGFNDCHCHILSFGLNLEQVDVGPDAVRTIEDIKRAVAQRAERTAVGDWIQGRGYDQDALQERRHPNRFDLDEAGRGLPVVIWHTSGHAMAVSTRALQIAGISENTDTPRGGAIERDERGQPTGVLKEAPAMDLVARLIPPPTVEQGAEAIIRALEVMASQGITSASDAATGHGPSAVHELTMYRKVLASGRMAGRIVLMPQIGYVAPPNSNEVHSPTEFSVGDQPEWLQIGATKIFSDGALSTRTAAVREPYAEGTGNTGLLIWEPAVLNSMVQRAHDAGWQVATHAIGDRAIETVLDAYEQALAATPREDARHRIEHCMMPDQAMAARIARLGIVPTIQPDIFRLGDAYVAALGRERAAQLIPMQLLDWTGVPVGFSSDRPVIPGAPLRVIRSAMQRTTPSGVVLGPQHAVTALEAIRHYTAGSAWATHTEDQKGSLRRGKLADFTVLSRNPAETPADDFGRMRVVMTVVGGVETYSE